MTDENNTGNLNTGYRNTGDLNTGNRNTGNLNTGYRNTGDWNTGDWNTGDLNTGNRNTGNLNTGDLNTGDLNTGYRNTGDWNCVNKESGFFNTIQSNKVRVFNKDCDCEIWNNAVKPNLIYFNTIKWIAESDMTDQEKIDNETFHTTGGYLKSYDYQEAFKKSWDRASEEDRALVERLPNFDADIFLEISGIDVRDGSSKKTNPDQIVVDGVIYERKQG